MEETNKDTENKTNNEPKNEINRLENETDDPENATNEPESVTTAYPDKETADETENEITDEPENETVKESENDTIKESEDEAVKEPENETAEELEKETAEESEDETGKEPDGEAVKEPETEAEEEPEDDSAKRLKRIFNRRKYTEPRHPILSSPFARHISYAAFGPKKPKWYTPLTTAQLYLFEDLVHLVNLGREGSFKLDEFVEVFKDLDPTIVRGDIVEVFDAMEKNEFEELDFGKFLFRLAYKQHADKKVDKRVLKSELKSKITLTARQSLILSAISYYVLIFSPEDIHRYYYNFTRPKQTVLKYHMESQRLEGLTEKQMEVKQKKARVNLMPLFEATGSPYALPVPFVPGHKRPKTHRTTPKKRPSVIKTALPLLKTPLPRPLKPIETDRELGDKVVFKNEDESLIAGLTYGHFPLPDMTIPLKKLKEMRNKCTAHHRDYIIERAEKAMKAYKDRMRKALVLQAKEHLRWHLREGFPSKHDEREFIIVHDRYLPRKEEDIKDFSLVVDPVGLDTGYPLYSHKIAFGRTVT